MRVCRSRWGERWWKGDDDKRYTRQENEGYCKVLSDSPRREDKLTAGSYTKLWRRDVGIHIGGIVAQTLCWPCAYRRRWENACGALLVYLGCA